MIFGYVKRRRHDSVGGFAVTTRAGWAPGRWPRPRARRPPAAGDCVAALRSGHPPRRRRQRSTPSTSPGHPSPDVPRRRRAVYRVGMIRRLVPVLTAGLLLLGAGCSPTPPPSAPPTEAASSPAASASTSEDGFTFEDVAEFDDGL